MSDLTPTFDDFKKMARQGNLIPVYREIIADTETPVSAFMKFRDTPECFLFESVEGGEKWARYSFIGFRPSVVFTSKGTSVTIRQGRRVRTMTSDNPLGQLRDLMSRYQPVPVPGLPRFWGGAVGYASYDTARFFETIPECTSDDLHLPDSCFMITDTLVIFDNLRHNVKVLSNVHLTGETPDLRNAYEQARARIEAICTRLQRPLRRTPVPPVAGPVRVGSNIRQEDFKKSVSRAKRYIRSGDIIQVVLSQRFETALRTDPFELYRSLRMVNPSPYMFFLRMDDTCLVGSSPEVLVRLEDGEILLRPIAGTRPRGASDGEDAALAEELLADPKERAEHIMLVDLGRNDVGRVAATGSVAMQDFMVIERYSHVMHIVSSVTGRLARGRDAFDVFAATFPAGTVSGAPKIRAMEIIEELEHHRRGAYAGAVGYFGFSGNMDFCITIRTMLIRNDRVYVQAGAGIVMDSRPEREYQETVNKARGMVQAIERAYKGL